MIIVFIQLNTAMNKTYHCCLSFWTISSLAAQFPFTFFQRKLWLPYLFGCLLLSVQLLFNTSDCSPATIGCFVQRLRRNENVFVSHLRQSDEPRILKSIRFMKANRSSVLRGIDAVPAERRFFSIISCAFRFQL